MDSRGGKGLEEYDKRKSDVPSNFSLGEVSQKTEDVVDRLKMEEGQGGAPLKKSSSRLSLSRRIADRIPSISISVRRRRSTTDKERLEKALEKSSDEPSSSQTTDQKDKSSKRHSSYARYPVVSGGLLRTTPPTDTRLRYEEWLRQPSPVVDEQEAQEEPTRAPRADSGEYSLVNLVNSARISDSDEVYEPRQSYGQEREFGFQPRYSSDDSMRKRSRRITKIIQTPIFLTEGDIPRLERDDEDSWSRPSANRVKGIDPSRVSLGTLNPRYKQEVEEGDVFPSNSKRTSAHFSSASDYARKSDDQNIAQSIKSGISDLERYTPNRLDVARKSLFSDQDIGMNTLGSGKASSPGEPGRRFTLFHPNPPVQREGSEMQTLEAKRTDSLRRESLPAIPPTAAKGHPKSSKMAIFKAPSKDYGQPIMTTSGNVQASSALYNIHNPQLDQGQGTGDINYSRNNSYSRKMSSIPWGLEPTSRDAKKSWEKMTKEEAQWYREYGDRRRLEMSPTNVSLSTLVSNPRRLSYYSYDSKEAKTSKYDNSSKRYTKYYLLGEKGWVVALLSGFIIQFVGLSPWGGLIIYPLHSVYYTEHGRLSSSYLPGSFFPHPNLLTCLLPVMTTAVCYFFAPISVYASHYFGFPLCHIIGTSLVALGLLMSSFTRYWWQLFITQALVVGMGSGVLLFSTYQLSYMVTRQHRSFYLGLVMSGMGLGAALMGLAYRAMIQHHNIRYMLRVQALIVIAVGVFVTVMQLCLVGTLRLLLPNGHRVYLHSVLQPLKRMSFLVTLLTHFFLIVSASAQQSYLPAYATHLGATTKQANNLILFINGASAAGVIFAGFVTEKFKWSYKYIPALTTFLCGLFTMTIWILAKNYASLLAYSILYGLLIGMFYCIVPVALIRLFGITRGIILLGFVFFLSIPAVVLSLFVGDILYRKDMHHPERRHFEYLGWFSGGFLLAACITGAAIPRYARKEAIRRSRLQAKSIPL